MIPPNCIDEDYFVNEMVMHFENKNEEGMLQVAILALETFLRTPKLFSFQNVARVLEQPWLIEIVAEIHHGKHDKYNYKNKKIPYFSEEIPQVEEESFERQVEVAKATLKYLQE